MGCDIHMYVEYRSKKDAESTCKLQRQFNSFGGRINPGRIYRLFAAIAGVRAPEDAPVQAQPRGLPADLGFHADTDSALYIVEGTPGHRECTLAQAEQWVANKLSFWVGHGQKRVSHPDWHSHSWMTYFEFQTAYDRLFDGTPYKQPEYRALLAAMRQLAADGYEVRVVFWFDN